MFELGGVPDAHAHRFRDTFYVELLLAGVAIEKVSILLGHQSVRITEKHYAPWVKARQQQLEADVRRSWPEEKLPQEVHPRVHRERGANNPFQIKAERMVEAGGVGIFGCIENR